MLTLDISNDFNYFDNTETITIQNKNDNPLVIDNVKRNAAVMGVDDGGGNVVYGAAIEFQIWKNCAPVDFVPKLNAKITDQFGKNYRVDTVEDMCWRTKWSVKATSDAGEGLN